MKTKISCLNWLLCAPESTSSGMEQVHHAAFLWGYDQTKITFRLNKIWRKLDIGRNFLYNHYRIQWILQEIDNGGFIVKKRNGHRLLAALIAVGMCSSMQITLPQKSAAAVAVETTVQNQGLRSDPAYIRGSKAIKWMYASESARASSESSR